MIFALEHNYYLAHYGVKGMKWKKRRRRESESDRLKRLGIYTSEQLEEYKKIQEMRKSKDIYDPKFQKVRELHNLGIYTSEQLKEYQLAQKIRKDALKRKANEEIDKKGNVKIKHYSSGDSIVKRFKNFISRTFNVELGGGGGSSSF